MSRVKVTMVSFHLFKYMEAGHRKNNPESRLEKHGPNFKQVIVPPRPHRFTEFQASDSAAKAPQRVDVYCDRTAAHAGRALIHIIELQKVLGRDSAFIEVPSNQDQTPLQDIVPHRLNQDKLVTS